MADLDITLEPLEHLRWMHWSKLKANDYNPNCVQKEELRLLELSILLTRWVQPVLVRAGDLEIIDGFHRWSLTRDSRALLDRYGGHLPVVTLELSRPQAMLVTVRMNRAKGQHVALRMSDLVRELVEQHGLSGEEVATGIGAHPGEIDLLLSPGAFKARNLKDVPYSKAWVPYEERGKP